MSQASNQSKQSSSSQMSITTVTLNKVTNLLVAEPDGKKSKKSPNTGKVEK
jgi:hypothetical protein